MSLDRDEREKKLFTCELVHASIKLEMSCTVAISECWAQSSVEMLFVSAY